MDDTTVSTIALLLCLAPGLLHLVEVAFPMLSRGIVNYVLVLFGPAQPTRAGSLTNAEQLAMLVNANHAGIGFLGHHPKVSRNGRNVGIVFTPFWAAATVLNLLAFSSSLPA